MAIPFLCSSIRGTQIQDVEPIYHAEIIREISSGRKAEKMGSTYGRDEAERGPLVLERLSDLSAAKKLLGDFIDIRGMTVVTPNGEDVGRVDNLYIDPKQHQPVMAEITFGGLWGFGAKRVMVPMDQIERVDEKHVRVMTTPEIVKNAPEFQGLEGGDLLQYSDYWRNAAQRKHGNTPHND